MDPASAAQKVIPDLLDRGVLGTVVVLLLVAVVYLWRYALGLQDKLAASYEARTTEAKTLAVDGAKALSSATVSAAALATAMDSANRIQQRVLDVVQSIPAQHEALAKLLDRNCDKIEELPDIIRGARK